MSTQQRPYFMYIALQDDDKISIFTVDPETGKTNLEQDVQVPGGPAPLAIDPSHNFLYVGRRGSQEIASYKIDHSNGGLSLIGTAPARSRL